MSLIKCAECDHQVSTDAKTCPNCGAKVKKPTSITQIIFIIVISAFMFKCVSDKEEATQHQANVEAAKTPEQRAASAYRDAQLQLAARGAQALKKDMKDPEAFTLTSAIVKDSGTACYEYRAKNSFGAILPSSAVMTGNGKLFLKERDGDNFILWNIECTVSGGTDIADLIKTLGIL